ncbi:hypothetical protein swp_0933 [Shewanella piezotolerans WP3]|uniref:2TM domain-containing protein n=1 Tax=Shewanella piezotolerans (strain WP3 / JCM 13877) TaxID=225849 RepID=B8CK35_SHEPW|nr:hypothetical protein [Shewanella piezotolerans]ACJ27738.1 hypothetical protein swp_0933 [Shewanella piezotolerans WP3]
MPDNKESTNKENNKEQKQYFFDNPKNTKWVMNIFYACCVLVVVLDFVINRHVYHSWENLPAFYPLYGFVGCVVLVVIARWMRTFLMRSEDYYDDDDLDNNNDENTHQGANIQNENKKVGDHNVDA